MQISRSPSEDEYDYEPRLSNSSSLCVLGPLVFLDSPRKNHYDRLRQEPLRLTVLRLDGSSFGIGVAKTGTVGELKQAVEAAFSHLPKKGIGSISWAHVWGQFCLCYEGQKLLSESDHIGLYGIKDGDQLQFVHQISNKYDLVKTESDRREEYTIDEHSISHGYEDDSSGTEIFGDSIDGEESDNSNDENRCPSSGSWFLYHKLQSSHTRTEDGSPSRSPNRFLGSFKNIFCFHSNKSDSRKETWRVD